MRLACGLLEAYEGSVRPGVAPLDSAACAAQRAMAARLSGMMPSAVRMRPCTYKHPHWLTSIVAEATRLLPGRAATLTSLDMR